ncbi:MAG: O-acetylhomoserine aminocarboxypropyltransferase/cysteine synthase [Deltaproteobacteria bacterium]|nr:O-acetylhomoserine aminocarboxypropyltransferase/cysteine synthase [Deltaproteobacteria bacterium]
MTTHGFETKAIHVKTPKQDVHGAIKFPIYAGAAFAFESAEAIEDAFAFRKPAHAYSRVTNPTVEAFERKINALEDGRGAIAVASGMAAITNAVLNLVKQGENIVSSDAIFGNTYSLFVHTLKGLGIETRFFDVDKPDSLSKLMDDKTRVLFLETISNPKMNVPDIKKLADMAHEKNIAVIVDSTVTTPYLFTGRPAGADVVIHSSTKLISGGATGIGGVITDAGNNNWSGFPALKPYAKFGKWAFLGRLRSEVYRNTGACMSPHIAYLHSLGLETLALRVEKTCENTLKTAEFLKGQDQVISVSYPGLLDSKYHEIAKKLFKNRFGGVISFRLLNREKCFDFINRLKLIKRASNLGDNTSLVIHPASTIFHEFSEKEKEAMGVTENLIRLSVGIETVDDLISDILQAME